MTWLSIEDSIGSRWCNFIGDIRKANSWIEIALKRYWRVNGWWCFRLWRIYWRRARLFDSSLITFMRLFNYQTSISNCSCAPAHSVLALTSWECLSNKNSKVIVFFRTILFERRFWLVCFKCDKILFVAVISRERKEKEWNTMLII